MSGVGKIVDFRHLSCSISEMVQYRVQVAPCRVSGCIVSIRPTYSCARALTYLHVLTQLALCDLSSVALVLVSPKIINVLYG